MKRITITYLVKILTIFVLIFSATFANQSFALGKMGHQLVCQLAFDNLPSTQQQKITELLLELPKKHQKIINKYNYRNKNAPISFAQACTWADAIKKLPEYDKYKSWHYLNISRESTSIELTSCRENCLIQAILYHQQQLSLEKQSWNKTKALMFLGHWLGDIHQPLHVSFASDLGGNKNKIITKNKTCNNLHWLWDECLLYGNNNRLKKEKIFDVLYKKLTQHWQKNNISQWQDSSVTEWATESLTLARSPSLLYCKVDINGHCQSMSNNTIKLPDNYYKKHTIVLEQRILKASVRLAKLIESSLL